METTASSSRTPSDPPRSFRAARTEPVTSSLSHVPANRTRSGHPNKRRELHPCPHPNNSVCVTLLSAHPHPGSVTPLYAHSILKPLAILLQGRTHGNWWLASFYAMASAGW